MNISFTDVKNPRHVDEQQTALVMDIKFDHMPDYVEFVAREDDVESHGREIYLRCLAGEFGPIGEYVVPTLSEEARKAMFKEQVTFKIESQARQLDFESLAEALTYCDESAVPLYQKRALAIRKWRSLVWAWYDEIIAAGKDTDVATFDTMPKFTL